MILKLEKHESTEEEMQKTDTGRGVRALLMNLFVIANQINTNQ